MFYKLDPSMFREKKSMNTSVKLVAYSMNLLILFLGTLDYWYKRLQVKCQSSKIEKNRLLW